MSVADEAAGSARTPAWLWLALPVLVAIAFLSGSPVEHALLALALAAAMWAAIDGPRRHLAGTVALILLLAAGLDLTLRLVSDDFAYRYVWLLSAPELAGYLKVANLWAGDEGTLLTLGMMSLVMARALSRYRGWAGPGAYAIAALFIAGALIWDPFRQTDADLLAAMPSRGMNAHLTRIWMAVHPPLVFFAMTLLLAPAGAALEALAHDRGDWKRISARYGRGAWLILSAGIAFGMWWAYEDFAYGTVWHWDPVQTAIFVVWCFLTAQLHAQRSFRPGGPFRLVHPLLAMAAAIAVILSMAVTRSPELASSHRYIGETSLPVLLVLAGLLAAATIAALVRRWLVRRAPRWPAGERDALIWIAIAIFTGAGLIGAGQVAYAYGSAYLGLPRPEYLKPFFETLSRFSHSGEIAELRAVFARWDVDNFSVNAWLAPVGTILGLVGGHYFLPVGQRARWAVSALVAAAAAATALMVRPFAAFYEGTGLTASHTVAIFPWLDALCVTLAYLAVAVVLWSVAAVRRTGNRASFGYYVSVGLIHLGAMMVIASGLIATVFDSYAQRIVSFPADFGKALDFPGGYRLRVGLTSSDWAADGARTDGADEAFHAVARVEWELSRDGRTIESEQGHTVYRDDRPPYSDRIGPVRLMCEMIDYRYARYASADRQMIHPFISRGLWRDVQVWMPAIGYRSSRDRSGAAGEGEAGRAPMVLKVIPAMTWLWIGLVLVIAGFAMLYAIEWRRSSSPSSAMTGAASTRRIRR